MKKFLLILMVLVFSLSTLSVSAADLPEKTEISFKIGDSTININGKQVTVEAPFVAGVGVTMVPVRVITEAFGANVGWDDDTQTVTVNYEDISISMVIGSKTAVVNGESKEMLEAPVVLGVGTTMIPLRFISETFGAVVGWDEATQAVTVTMNKTEDTVIYTTDYITDSHWGWSMKAPEEIVSYDETDDKMTAHFLYENKIQLLLTVFKTSDEARNFDEVSALVFQMLAPALNIPPEGCELLRGATYTGENTIYMSIYSTPDNYTLFYAVFASGDKMYEHYVAIEGICPERYEEVGAILDTFTPEYTENLTDIQNIINDI